MLGEVYRLRKALEEAGMEMQKLHPSIKPPGPTTGPIIRARLAKDGSVVGLEAVTEGEISGLWTHMDGNHNSFPVLRIREPLFVVPDGHQFSWQASVNAKAKKVNAADKRRELYAATLECPVNSGMENTLELLTRISANKVEVLTKAAERANVSVVAEVCYAFQAALAQPDEQESLPAFLNSLRKQAIHFLETCDENSLKTVELLLFTPAKMRGASGNIVQLALDSNDPDSRMYRSSTQSAITVALLDESGSIQPASDSERDVSVVACAYTGNRSEALYTAPFPKVRLPIVAPGGASLFTMNSTAPCNERYGQKDNALMPVSHSVVDKMMNALSYIVAPERKGKTWRPIAGDKPEKTDLLIVYVDGMLNIDENITELYDEPEDQKQQQYEKNVTAICVALDAVVKKNPQSRMTLFIIRKVSEGQVFVALVETPTVAEVLEGARWWQQAARNIPFFTLPIWVEKKQEDWSPQVPSPVQVVQTLTQLWTPSGGESGQPRVNKARGVAFGEVLNLMLPRPQKRKTTAQRILQTLVQREKSLLIGIGGCLNGVKIGKNGLDNYSDTARKTALRAASLLGIALYALNSKKEDYVTQEAFRIGQFLALADRLHYCYCTVVRDKSYPPNLIGNTAFDTALDNPVQALANLAPRIKVYIAWAKTVQPNQYASDKAKYNDAWEAKRRVMEQCEVLAASLKEAAFKLPCDDTMKAQMLLGYLAGPDETTKPSTTGNNGVQDDISKGENE